MNNSLPEFLQGLNPAQLEAALHVDGPMLVLAGPGSGKTRVVTARVANLLSQGIHDDRIAALTFTNKAAEEMRQRVRRQYPGHQVWVSTFHRFCSMLLRRYGSLVGLAENFTILDADDSMATIKHVIEDHAIRIGRYTPAQIARAISNAKNELLLPDAYAQVQGSLLEQVSAEVYDEYQRRLVRSNSVDFDDLLMHVAHILQDNGELRQLLDEHFQYILVDEYQDTNMAQYTIVRGLALTMPNVSVTGDPDQSIYSWRGADIENILRFERDYPTAKVVRLEQNYRSTKSILGAADRLIRYNQQRKQKGLVTENEMGAPVRIVEYETGDDEANDIASRIATQLLQPDSSPRDFAIFYRTNALSRVLERALRRHRIPYQIVHGVEFYRRKEVRDIIAYLQLINNPRNDVALLRIINEPPRGIGRATLEKIREFATEERISLLEAAANPALQKRLTRKPAKALSQLVAWLRAVIGKPDQSISAMVQLVLEKSGYEESLKSESGEEDLQRLANIKELVSAARDFEQSVSNPSLDQFLETSTLAGETDTWDRQQASVTMMTLHAAKGLEFPRAFVVAVEQGLIPHERAIREGDALEEERRLLFVGITRAMHELQLSFARYRDYAGNSQRRISSSFLREVQGPQVTFEQVASVPIFENDLEEPLEDGDDTQYLQAPRSRNPADSLPSIHQIRDPAHPPHTKRTPKRGTLRIAAAVDIPPHRTSADPSSLDASAQLTHNDTNVSHAEFRTGRLVNHPEYGIGKIIGISGIGGQATCRVQFFDPLQQLSFRIAASPLEVIGG